MRHTDIAIVGGGLAGSSAAAMLGRAGLRSILIDPHTVYPPDFRCEKLDKSQIRLLEQMGLAPAVFRAGTRDDELWIARFGHLVEKRRNNQCGILYDTLVNTIRGEVPAGTEVVHAKANAISTGPDRQRITLSNGEEISARLVVLANGLNVGLRHSLGIERMIVSPAHSISIGFDIIPVGRSSFDFRSLTYYGESAAARMAYLTLFPIGSTTRANLFVYRDMRDPWLKTLREKPRDTLFALMPNLRKLTGDIEVSDIIKIRPVDLYVTEGHRQPGVVLVGDAFATSCPAAGTGANKVLTDVERLCNVYIPGWLATPSMGVEKIAAFYDDTVKVASDSHSAAKAFYLRSLSTEAGMGWQARRWSRFMGQLGVGVLRQARERLSPPDRREATVGGNTGRRGGAVL
jgi:2-polyprenyl-6-methoxyphenol hydroxylase-like FAD-dependent oxidoreductase